MPPKKSSKQATAGPESASRTKDPAPATQNGQPQASKKRKTPQTTDEPRKAARRSNRAAPQSQPSQIQILKYLLSKDAEELCRPDEEAEDIKSRGDIRTYGSSVMNPFEELLCAVILSRPISHRLGLRTIRTVLNNPYNFTSAKAVRDAGPEKIHQAIWDARTQHKQKTTEQILRIGNTILDKYSNSKDSEGKELQKVLDENDGDVDDALQSLQDDIKGFGKTGSDIFLRRVQWIWKAGYPFVDHRTAQALKILGLPNDAEKLRVILEQHWSKLDAKRLAGKDEATKKRRAFVVILERAVGADLEAKTNALLNAASKSS